MVCHIENEEDTHTHSSDIYLQLFTELFCEDFSSDVKTNSNKSRDINTRISFLGTF